MTDGAYRAGWERRPRCDHWMPVAEEHCGAPTGHAGSHVARTRKMATIDAVRDGVSIETVVRREAEADRCPSCGRAVAS